VRSQRAQAEKAKPRTITGLSGMWPRMRQTIGCKGLLVIVDSVELDCG
jgi:hypothetical protein